MQRDALRSVAFRIGIDLRLAAADGKQAIAPRHQNVFVGGAPGHGRSASVRSKSVEFDIGSAKRDKRGKRAFLQSVIVFDNQRFLRGDPNDAHAFGIIPLAEEHFRRVKFRKLSKVDRIPAVDGHVFVRPVRRKIQTVFGRINDALCGKRVPLHRHEDGGADRLALGADRSGDRCVAVGDRGDDAVIIHLDDALVAAGPIDLLIAHASCGLDRREERSGRITRQGKSIEKMSRIVPHRHISGDQTADVQRGAGADGRVLFGRAKDIHAAVIVEADLRRVLSLFVGNDGSHLRRRRLPNHFICRNAGEHLAKYGVLPARILVVLQIDLVAFQHGAAVFDNDGFYGNIHKSGSNEPSAGVNRQNDENGN